jgi:hypothetical protein
LSVFRNILALSFGFLVLGGLGDALAAFPAPAPFGSSGTASVTFDGLQFSVSAASCTYTQNGSVQSSCAGSGDQLAIIASNRGQPTLAIEPISASNALSCTHCGGATSLHFTLVVTRASGSSATVTSFSNALSGSGTSNVYSNVSYTGGGSANVTLASPTNSATFSNALPSSMSFTVNLGLGAFTTGTLSLAMDALHFSPAPEPASIALIATGLTGLTVVRRRVRRNRSLR